MPERDYSHRDVVDKLGVKPGQAVAFADHTFRIDPALHARVVERAGRDEPDSEEPLDIVLAAVSADDDAVAVLTAWRSRIHPAGGIWLLTPKRGQPGYVDQTDLISAGQQAGLVDNKTCSVSETTSGMRFVIRKADRPK